MLKPKRLIKRVLYKFLPSTSISRLEGLYFKYNVLRLLRKQQEKTLNSIRKKEKIKVCFIVIHGAVWKYEYVYKFFEKDPRFDPIVVICPYTMHDADIMFAEMNRTFDQFFNEGYNVISSYLKETDSWLDVKKVIKPDVVFFTNPHKLTKDQYYINNFLDTLTVYVPYAYVVIHLIDMHYNQNFHHFLWRHYCETDIHEGFASKYAKSKRFSNVRVSGYPGLDSLLLGGDKLKNVWKANSPSAKRIIWAPHHTIDDSKEFLSYSNFFDYAELLFNYARNNKDKIQIAFKPHPLLKPKLYKHPNWGKSRTDEYYEGWANLSNGQLEEGSYIELFYHSDAMIMDSASFMAEYLYTGKPILFMMPDEAIKDRFNDFGKLVFEILYHSRNQGELMEFINDVVYNGQDKMKEERTKFFKEVMMPENAQTSSEFIYNDIVKELC